MNTRIHYVLRSYIMKYIVSLFLLLSMSVASHSLDASYDIGSDLVLLQTAHSWFETKDYDPDLFPPPQGYHAVYWNPKTNEYYYATGDEKFGNLSITNNLSYEIDPAKQETNYIDTELEYIEYAGSISPLERLYIDKKDGTQYIKILKKITDDIVVVYPNFKDGKFHNASYTNAEGRRFGRTLGNKYQKSKGALQEF